MNKNNTSDIWYLQIFVKTVKACSWKYESWFCIIQLWVSVTVPEPELVAIIPNIFDRSTRLLWARPGYLAWLKHVMKLSHCQPFQLNISFLWVRVWSRTWIFLTVLILCVLALSFWLPLHHDPYWEGSAVSCRLGCQLSRPKRSAGVEDVALVGTEWLENISAPLPAAAQIFMGCASKERCRHYLNFGKAESQGVGID